MRQDVDPTVGMHASNSVLGDDDILPAVVGRGLLDLHHVVVALCDHTVALRVLQLPHALTPSHWGESEGFMYEYVWRMCMESV